MGNPSRLSPNPTLLDKMSITDLDDTRRPRPRGDDRGYTRVASYDERFKGVS